MLELKGFHTAKLVETYVRNALGFAIIWNVSLL